jgi:CBS domain-containing protein
MKTRIEEIMTKDLTTIESTATLQVAKDRMDRDNIRHLPVTNKLGQLVGILSERDVHRGMSLYTDFVRSEFTPIVADYMSFPVEHVASSTEIQELAHRMMSLKISAFIVNDGKKMVGIVTSEDLLRVLVNLLDEKAAAKQAIFEDEQPINYYSPVGEIANMLSQAGI